MNEDEHMKNAEKKGHCKANRKLFEQQKKQQQYSQGQEQNSQPDADADAENNSASFNQ